MSDRIEELSKSYRKNVSEIDSTERGQPPSYDCPVVQGMWSAAVGVVLATLRYVAPAVFTLLWGQQSLLYRFLKHIESAVKSLIYSSDVQRDSVLKWIGETGPARIESLETVWRHGWLLCGALDAAIPGACAGHSPTRLSIEHAQTIAENYLGVEPVFSRQELENNDSLSKHQEWRFAHYLSRVRQAVGKLSPPVSKQSSPCGSPECQFTLDFVARGAGLTAAQINQKNYFKIYPTAQQSLEPTEITIAIKGPNDSYGITTAPAILGKAQLIRQKVLGLQNKPRYTENVLPLTQGTTYLRTYGKNDMNKTYFIPKERYEIKIDVEKRPDHLKVGYMAKTEGKYEISITSRGTNIVGSPFTVTATDNIITILENESFSLEDGEEIDIVDVKTDRKVVLRIVDFVTEKMLLRENGTLEKISDDEAKVLMNTDNLNSIGTDSSGAVSCYINRENTFTEKEQKEPKECKKTDKFKNISIKVSKIVKVCKIFTNLLKDKIKNNSAKEQFILSCSQKDIPDIVNSTLSDVVNPIMSFNECKQVHNVDTEQLVFSRKIAYKENYSKEINDYTRDLDLDDRLRPIKETGARPKIIHEDNKKKLSRNPFLKDLAPETQYGDLKYAKVEPNIYYALPDPIEIFINEEIEEKLTNTNPFLDINILELERPKTPILKIITGDVKDRDDSLYVVPVNRHVIDETQSNEFVNLFFLHEDRNSQTDAEEFPVTDFIIGAPVSLPPVLKAPTPDPDVNSTFLSAFQKHENDGQSEYRVDTTYPTANSTLIPNKKACQAKEEIISNVYNIESHCNPISPLHTLNHNSNVEFSDTFETVINVSTINPSQNENFETFNKHSEALNKELWDSAYVSIDDNNSSPDTNNNTSISECPNEQSFLYYNGTNFEAGNINILSEMGPAEREIWQTCNELSDVKGNVMDDSKMYKIKRPIFTPIIEENERSLSSGKIEIHVPDKTNDDTNVDQVAMAFAELNDIFQEYYPQSEPSSLTSVTEKEKFESIEINHTIERNNCVDSASDNPDVKRRYIKENTEETISEVQANATELQSVSRALHENRELYKHFMSKIKIKNEFRENVGKNIVLEKKKYWDEKIQQIEEMKAQQPKKKKISPKPLKHNDSLTKRKGKQLVKNFLNATDVDITVKENMPNLTYNLRHGERQESQSLSSEKLVDKWKKYWDDKLEHEKEENLIFKFPKTKEPLKVSEISNNYQAKETEHLVCAMPSISPVKQEIAEEVFKAFETSPKRFFGTSRKQILNKIDAFLKKPSDNCPLHINDMKQENGIVSSRITLYHNISNTEDSNTSRKSSPGPYSPNKEGISQITTGIDKNNDLLQNTKSSGGIDNDTVICQTYEIDNQKTRDIVPKQINYLRKSSVSKSEMDIFNKVNLKKTRDNESYKSYDDLPKINVKNVISLYENVTRSNSTSSTKQTVKQFNVAPTMNTRQRPTKAREYRSISPQMMRSNEPSVSVPENKQLVEKVSSLSDHKVPHKVEPKQTFNVTGIDESELHTEIVDLSMEYELTNKRETPERDVFKEYKTRFKLAKEYFQSLEELRSAQEKKPTKPNECEILLHNQSPEPKQENSKKKFKSNTFPSTQLANAWEIYDKTSKDDGATKLVKISEKFNVDDLFNDVVGEGKLRRQGSFKGIPHKKAVLETFKSMENISDAKINSYEIAIAQLSEFAKENNIKNAQTYLTEYPYLPKTDPNKYHSRYDATASGLISRRELLNSKPRRNSVPNLKLNATFTAQL